MGLQRGRALLAAAALAGVSVCLTACNETLDTSAGCPLACGSTSPQIQTVTLNAVALDATVPAAPGLGTESEMLLASRGDTLDTRVIIRFDTLPSEVQTQAGSLTTAPISVVDSAYLHLHFDTAAARLTAPMTISVYDVDTTAANDTAVAVLAPLFSPARLLTSQSYAAGALPDTMIQLPSAFVLARAQSGRPLRLGLRISSAGSVSIPILSSGTSLGPRLTMRISSDAAIPAVVVFPHSRTPVGDRIVAANLADFTLVVVGTPPPPAAFLAVGGLPASRTYIRFDIPPRIVDSSIVVRATLVLTQLPSVSPAAADTMRVQPTLGVAGAVVTDPVKAAQITSNRLTGFEPLVTFPQSAGTREIEIAPAFKVWALQADTVLPRVIVLQNALEQLSPQQALFYSSDAADSTVHPKLRISYTLHARVGTP